MKSHKVPWIVANRETSTVGRHPSEPNVFFFMANLWWPPESFCSLAASNALGAYVHACFEGHMHKKSGRTTNKNASTMHWSYLLAHLPTLPQTNTAPAKKKPNPRPQSRHSEANTWKSGTKTLPVPAIFVKIGILPPVSLSVCVLFNCY